MEKVAAADGLLLPAPAEVCRHLLEYLFHQHGLHSSFILPTLADIYQLIERAPDRHARIKELRESARKNDLGNEWELMMAALAELDESFAAPAIESRRR